MTRLFIKSYLRLIQIDLLMSLSGLQSVHALVRKSKVRRAGDEMMSPVADLCRAIDLACVFYFKTVLCLQRSAATTLVLRQHGHKAEMVIGAQMLPFKSHAWVEIESVIVNDKPYMVDIYQVLERC